MAAKDNKIDEENALQVAGDIVASFVSKNTVELDQLPSILRDVYAAVSALGEGGTFQANREPAVSINKSITPEHIICLEDGKKLKMLKRYLRTHYDLSPEEYKRKWGLPADYPMTAPNYAKKRSKLAKQIGLGTAEVTTRTRKRTKRKKSTAPRKRSAA